MSENLPACARCSTNLAVRICQKENGKAPPVCPTINHTRTLENALKELKKPDVMEFARQASIQEAEGYADRNRGYEYVKPSKPRIVETMEFAHRMKYKRLGFVFCIGLRKEAKVVESLLSSNGFEVVSAVCKLGREPKETIGVRDDQKIYIGKFESMCHPIAQAYVLNAEQTEFNIVMGLCVGHDSLFLKYSKSPCTVLAVKDRLLGHNPLAAIYNIDSYYRALK
ncbi:MAG TPA: DUF1847 domain-containing protein [Desulfobacterales bacterium]|nr:DUF1847 domain-containing protein [Desulfobacterales bacterium]